eukprot:6186981-Pleurochrysis_carterae.AAC.1
MILIVHALSRYLTTSRWHPPPCGVGVLFTLATPHDAVGGVHAGVIHSPTHRPPVSPAGAVWETPVRCTATAVALRVAARQRNACFDGASRLRSETE